MKSLPQSVKICECWARDGIQGEEQFIPTEIKIRMINKSAEIGFKRIEVTSFAHPKLVKQFSDAIDVLKGIDRSRDDVTFIAIIPNEKGLDRLLEAQDKGYGVHEITVILAASEDYLLASLERGFDELMPPAAGIVKRAKSAGLGVIGCIGTAFGCPLSGPVPVERVIELTEFYLEAGATKIMIGDTTGEANPRQVREVYGMMKDRFPKTDFIAHFHDTRGMGLANAVAALDEGITCHDSSFGGIGGQPATRRPKYHKGFAGNVCTEDLVVMMEEMGIDTGLSVPDVIDMALEIETAHARHLHGHVTRSGNVRHRNSEALTINQLRPGMEIPPALFFLSSVKMKEISEKHLPETVIREALDKNWAVHDDITINTDDVNVHGELEERDILITCFEVSELKKESNQAELIVSSQKNNGDVFLDGAVKLSFKKR